MVAFRSPKPSVRVRIFLLLQEIEVWCNGSTLDFGSNSSGSNPDTSTEQCRVGRVVHPSVCKTDYIGSNPVPDSKCLCGVMDSTPDYGSVSEGSSPSRDTKVCYI